jgi:hypothetical protein
MDELKKLQKEVESIQLRNKRVEKEKGWETSCTRRISVVIVTYLVMCLIFSVILVDRPFVNAIVPTVGYFLSTFSVGLLKNWWMKRQ